MAKKRTPEQNRAIYARRVARAKATGYQSYPEARKRRAEHRPTPADVTARPRAKVQKLPGGSVTRAVGADARAQIRAAVEAAERAGQPVEITVTFETARGIRSKRLREPVPADEGGGGGGGGRDRGAWETAEPMPVGPVQVHAGTAAPGGANATDWLDFFDQYDDLYDAFWEAFGDEYF